MLTQSKKHRIRPGLHLRHAVNEIVDLGAHEAHGKGLDDVVYALPCEEEACPHLDPAIALVLCDFHALGVVLLALREDVERLCQALLVDLRPKRVQLRLPQPMFSLTCFLTFG